MAYCDDWILPPGTVKAQCDRCPRLFASRNGALTCAYCIDSATKREAFKRKKSREAQDSVLV